MFVTALLWLMAPAPACQTPPSAPPSAPQLAPASEEFTSKSVDGITVRHDKSIELATGDFEALLSTMRLTRSVVKNGFNLELPFEPVVTVRRVANSKRAYYTDAEDKIFFDFPSEHYLTRLQLGDERVVRYALPAYLQIWLYRSLSSTAGLDHRILDSLTDYGMFLYKQEVERMSPQIKAPDAPEGYGLCWHQLETIHPGTMVFMLNNLSASKVAGHMVGARLRELAIAVTDDPAIAQLFDSISPTEPLLSADDRAPSAPLNAASPLRTGRLALWNGVPLLDVADEEIAVAERMNEFEKVFLMATMTAPDNKVRREPPAIRDIDLWRTYFEFRPRVLKARDNFDYYLVLREFLARFQDRSIGITPSQAIPVPPGSPYWCSIAGMKIDRSGDRFYVSRVTPEKEPAKAGLVAGLEVTAIDGRAPDRVLELMVDVTRTWDSCPSRQRAEAAAMNSLLSGPKDSTCTLTLRDPTQPKGKAYDVKLLRGLPPDPKAPPPSVTFDAARPDQIGAIKINNFAADSLQRFSAAIDEANKKGLRGLIIDLRGNEGYVLLDQKQRTSSAMLGRLLPIDSGKVVIGNAVRRARRANDPFEHHEATEIVIERLPGTSPFAGRLCVLTDAWTGGEAEWFALGFQLAKLGPVIGQQTAGSVTVPKAFEPKFQSLTASKLDISLSSSAVFHADGSLLQSIGIKPQFEVVPQPADWRADRDAVLERAAELLRLP